MIEKYEYNGEDYKTVMGYGSWRIGLINYSERFSKFCALERHLETDEAFILLDGKATLYTDTERVEMQKRIVYNIPKGVWHHVVMSEDATVMVVENIDTDMSNSEIKEI